MTITYKIRFGAVSIDSRQISSNVLPCDILVDLRLDMINAARVRLNSEPGDSLGVGDPVEIELGVDESQKVFTGTAGEIKKEIQGWTVYCQSSLAALVNGRLNKLYEQQKAGDIVKDLAQMAGIATGNVEDGLQFPVYVLGDDRSMFDHALDLARRSGFDCYADQDDRTVFAKVPGGVAHPLQYGVNIVRLELDDRPAAAGAVEVYGESPSSSGQGAQAYSWLTKQAVKGSAGDSGAGALRLIDPALKDLDSAGSVAQSVLDRISKTKSGTVKVLGSAGVKLGDSIEITGLPDRSLDGNYKVTGVKHILNRNKGFITIIDWTER